MRLKNQNGSMILGVALAMAVIAGLVYFYSNVQLVKVTAEYRRTQSMAYAHQIAGSLAQNLRLAYDRAKLNTANPLECTGPGEGIVNVPGSAVNLCLTDRQTCTAHPGNPNRQQVCVGFVNNTIFAKTNSNDEPRRHLSPPDGKTLLAAWVSLAAPKAMAQGFAPVPPPIGTTANNLLAAPTCVGGTCNVICGTGVGTNADCLTFKFCPLLGSTCDPAKPDDWVFQTVAFLR